MSFIQKAASEQIVLEWKDLGNLIIYMTVNLDETLEVKYKNGRGPFKGTYRLIDNNYIFQIDFTDGVNPDAGKQVGVLDFKQEIIYWGNDTQWKRV